MAFSFDFYDVHKNKNVHTKSILVLLVKAEVKLTTLAIKIISCQWLYGNKFSLFFLPFLSLSPLGTQRHLITLGVTPDSGTSSKLHTTPASPRRICPITSASHCFPHWHLSSFHISQVSPSHKGDYSAGEPRIHFHH